MPDDFLALITSGVESDGNPLAKNPKSSASGAYQMLDKTWQSLGNPGSARDAPPEVQAAQAHKLRLMNDSVLEQAGIPINPQTQYLAWAQGAGGAKALIKNPDKTAVQALIDAGVPPRQAAAQVLQNGGTVDMRAGDFAQRIVSNLNRAGGRSMASADTGMAGGGFSPVLQQLLGDAAPDATEKKLFQAAQDQSDKTAAGLEAGNTKLQALGQQMAGLHSPNPINAADFTPPNKQQIEKDELAKVSNDPGNVHRVMSQFLPVLAILAGSFAKNNAFAGMAAATAAMNAAKANDQAAVEKAHTEFTDAMTELKTRLDTAKTVYDENRNKYGDDMAGFAAQQSIQEAIDGNDMSALALKEGNFTRYFDLTNAKFAAHAKMADVYAAMENHKDSKQQILQDGIGGPSYVYNMNTHQATTLDGAPYTPVNAASHIQSGRPISMAADAMQSFDKEHPNATAKDKTEFAMQYMARTAAGKAFSTGPQGQSVRSLNVAVAHLDTLRELGHALNNGDVTSINAARQRFAEELGVPAPTNFDAAKSIVADEVAKAVIGGQTAQADRDKLADSLRKERSPQVLDGTINNLQKLLGGQLGGLRAQYKHATGEDDFDDLLSPSTKAALESGGPAAEPMPKTRDALVKGTLYETARGPAIWNGDKFEAQ